MILLTVLGAIAGCRLEPTAEGLATAQSPPELREGDVLLIPTGGELMEAVKDATGSSWTHCGVVLRSPAGELVVLEAIEPVTASSAQAFLSRSINGQLLQLRPRGGLNETQLAGMRAVGRRLLGRPYDALFLWDDEQIYCSELVWKVYAEGAGLELVQPSRFGDFRLDGPRARRMLSLIHPDGAPLEEPVVPPNLLEHSRLLEVVE